MTQETTVRQVRRGGGGIESDGIERAAVRDGELEVTLRGGQVLRFPAMWLRDSCPCTECADPVGGQKLHDVTDIGQGITLLVLTLALILACLAARRLNGALLTAVSLAVASVLTELVLKPLIGETIGRPAVLSYPSGHTTTAFTLTAVIVVLLADPPSGRPAPHSRLCRLFRAAPSCR